MTRLAALLAPFVLSACALAAPDRIHYVWDADATTAPAAAPSDTDFGDTFVGLALSGGGSRSATFSAAALEALHEHGLLSHTTHISSVSGGGFAASWYVLNRPDACADDTEACADAFAAFQDAMRHNYLADVASRQVKRPGRLTSPTRRLSSLADAFDEQFIGGVTFADLPASPILLINAARYDDGRRFVFSTLVLADDDVGIPTLADPRLRAASFSSPGCPRATPGEFSFALAIAASAAFPFVLGPATLEAHLSCGDPSTAYWHLGDGGVIENTGVETLQEVALRTLHSDNRPERILVFSIDGEMVSDPADSFADSDLSIWTSNPSRIVDVAMERGRGYQDLVWAGVRANADVPFELISVRYTDARLTTWPVSCEREAQRGVSITDHIAAIPTSLRISACNADLMAAAAHQLVHQTLNARVEALIEQGFELRRVAPH